MRLYIGSSPKLLLCMHMRLVYDDIETRADRFYFL